MVSKDLISLIVPFYNVENYLDRCIETLVNQTYKNLEIILIDDGSADSSGAIADAWQEKDGRIRVFHKENGGQSSARNLGLKKAEGKYIGFVDSDDYAAVNFVETLYSLLVNGNADISAVGWQVVSNTVSPVQDTFEPSDTVILDRYEAVKELFAPDKYQDYLWNKLFRKELLNGFEYPEGQLYEDLGTTYLLLDRCDRMVYNPVRLYYYYHRAGSTITRKTLKVRHDQFDMHRKRYVYVKDKYPDIEKNYRHFFSIGLLLFQYQEEENKQWLREELRELWPRVKKDVCERDRFKYFLFSFSEGLYCALCGAKKRIIK